MIFTYNKETRRVTEYSRDRNDINSERFDSFEYNPTELELERIRAGDYMFIRDGKLELEIHPLLADEDIKQKEQLKQVELKNKINKAKSVEELKEILHELIK